MRKAFFNLHIAIFLAGFTAIFGRLITLNEAILVWYRLLISVVCLGAFLVFTNRFINFGLKKSLNFGLTGGLIAIHWVLFYGSIKYSNISIALVCLSSMAFFTAFLEPLINKKKLDWVEVFFGVVTILGIYIIFDFHPQYKTGIVFGLVSSLFSSVFSVLNKQYIEKYEFRNLLFYELAGGAIVLTFIMPLYLHFFPSHSFFPSNTDWVWLIILAVVCTLFAFDLQLRAMHKVSAFTVSLSYNLEPVYGIIMAFVFFNESSEIHTQFYIGAAIIALTIIFHTLTIWYRGKKVNPYEKALIE